MKKILLAASICASCACSETGAQVVTATDYRYTFNFNRVQVVRMPNPTYWNGQPPQSPAARKEAIQEIQQAVTMAAQVVTAGYSWQYRRNCHDYAWAPFMTDSFYSNYTPQPEAWWMDDPTKNVTDGSMRLWCTSRGVYRGEYYFLKSDLDSLASQYQDVYGHLLQVPVSYDQGFVSLIPEHSAYLYSYQSIPGLDSQYVVLYVQSKWGDGPLMVHPWSDFGCPYPVNQSVSLAIYVPNGYNYWWLNIWHSPW